MELAKTSKTTRDSNGRNQSRINNKTRGKSMNTITHETEEQFYSTIRAMVLSSLRFTADAGKLTVTLTGGY